MRNPLLISRAMTSAALKKRPSPSDLPRTPPALHRRTAQVRRSKMLLHAPRRAHSCALVRIKRAGAELRLLECQTPQAPSALTQPSFLASWPVRCVPAPVRRARQTP